MTRHNTLLAALVVGLLLSACSRGKDEGAAAPPEATATVAASPAPSPAADVAAASPSPTPEPAAASPSPAPVAGPPSPPAPRNVNGLMVVDEVWVGEIKEPGGLRIRSAPRVEPGNVVGSVAQGTRVNVEGRVLNGQEAEAGKGTVWLIVGPSQYIYAAPGYVERVR